MYNEIDPYAAQWLRNLVAAGHIADGVVNESDIRDLTPAYLKQFTQCHFFAGIGVWSLALRRAGWPDDRPIWTGSCPCQPFSAAGRGDGFADERHLWPAFYWLIDQCRPPVVTGEQVASADGIGWLELVSSDLERAEYAFGASDLCAAGFGSAHIRQRIYFLGVDDSASARCQPAWSGQPSEIEGDRRIGRGLLGMGCDGERLADASDSDGRSGVGGAQEGTGTDREWRRGSAGCGADGRLGDAQHPRLEGHRGDGDREGGRSIADRPSLEASPAGGMADRPSGGCGVGGDAPLEGDCGHTDRGGDASGGVADAGRAMLQPGPERGNDASQARSAEREAWQRDGERGGAGDSERGSAGTKWPRPPLLGRNLADWLLCRDGRWRPVEPGTFPLAHGAPSRVGRLRAYGNGLDAETAEGFVRAVIAAIDEPPAPPTDLFGLMAQDQPRRDPNLGIEPADLDME